MLPYVELAGNTQTAIGGPDTDRVNIGANVEERAVTQIYSRN